LCDVHRRAGDCDKLKSILKERLQLAEKRRDYRKIVEVWGELGDVLRTQRQYCAAAEAYETAIDTVVTATGDSKYRYKNGNMVGNPIDNDEYKIGYCRELTPIFEHYALMEKREGRLANFEQLALAAEENSLTEGFTPPVTWSLRLSQYYYENNDVKRARAHFKKAIAELDDCLTGDIRVRIEWPEIINSEFILPLRKSGRIAEAEQLASRVKKFCASNGA
jgi:tetratricopeptide (TPR) repeat protein